MIGQAGVWSRGQRFRAARLRKLTLGVQLAGYAPVFLAEERNLGLQLANVGSEMKMIIRGVAGVSTAALLLWLAVANIDTAPCLGGAIVVLPG